MEIVKLLEEAALLAVETLFGARPESSHIVFQRTKKEFTGDYTLVVFPLLKVTKLNPEQSADKIGAWLKEHSSIVSDYNIIKGFLNVTVDNTHIINVIKSDFEFPKSGKIRMVEYSSPNTNKPLHLGHVRNNLLGYAIAEIMKFAGDTVYKVNLVNDRGIHICKSMVAWKHFGNGETPESSGMKGDHLVGKYYVEFDKQYKKEIAQLIEAGKTKEDAEKQAPVMLEAQDMLRDWEAGKEDVVNLWKTMNDWVYKGFDESYKLLGVNFDKFYYESQTYLLGKKIIQEGLQKNVFFKKDDGSVWIDLTDDGLDQKLVLRADGTSVYITQDIGTAVERVSEFGTCDMIYVVGNEQDYHFKVLKLILKKLGYGWSDQVHHLSYGMVELPEGKMKSREGTVVDADDLIHGMIETARETTMALGKTEGLDKPEADNLFKNIGLAALKYFILKVDPKKKMLFNPKESIDLNGHTGPFIQYTHARIQSILAKEKPQGTSIESVIANEKERELLIALSEFKKALIDAVNELNPAVVANYTYELAKLFNQFYHDHSILKESDPQIKEFRLQLAQRVQKIIKQGMALLGIEVPDRM